MSIRTVLVSGAGIGGPTLAYWLHRRGCQVAVIERAPQLRDSGSAVDFRGKQMDILARTGILDEVRARQTGMGEQVVVDEWDRPLAALPSEIFSGEVEIDRGALTRILYERTKDSAEYIFGDWITGLSETPGGVHVTFAHHAPRTFDLVAGADGMHSGVRRLAFGDEADVRTDTGYYIASCNGANVLNLDHVGRIYNVPGKGVMVSSSTDPAMATVGFVWKSGPLDYDRHDLAQQQRLVEDAFAGVGWAVPRLLAEMRRSPDLYFDTISQITMGTWSAGRVVLLGDAAWCAGPGGNGTGLAMMGAFILAGELATRGDDYRAAFAAYERYLRPAAAACAKQARNSGPFLAPATQKKLKQRNRAYRMLSTKLASRIFVKMSQKTANLVTLPDYPELP